LKDLNLPQATKKPINKKMDKYLCCLLAVFLLSTFAQLAQASEDSKQNSEIQGRDGTISLNGNNAWWTGAIYIVPILLIIVLLDFAIFGTFASRADELNPVSKFFFHARNGLHLLRNKRRRQYQEKYYKRVQRSIQEAAPILEALQKKQALYQ